MAVNLFYAARIGPDLKPLVMTPGPTNVPDRVMNALIRPITSHRCEEFSAVYQRLLEKSRQVFVTEGEVAILTASGTGGVEAAVNSVVRSHDTVIVASFGEFGERLSETVRLAGADVIRVDSPYGSAPEPDEIEAAFRKTGNVKAFCTVSNETSTGVRFKWLREAGEIASRYGSFFIVDAVSNLAGDEIPVDQLGIDVCATCTHKCLAAPPGLSLLSVSRRAKDFVTQHQPSSMYFDLARVFRFSEKSETPFTPSLPLFYALDEALSLVLEEGLSARIRRHQICAEAFYEALETLHLEGFAEEDVRSNTVIAFKYSNGIDDTRFRRKLEEAFHIQIAGGFGDYKEKLFRIGSMGEVGPYHVLTTVSAIASSLLMLGAECDPGAALGAAERGLRPLN